MSTNYKNIQRPEYFKNFTTKIKHREILVESGKALNGNIQTVVKNVNSKVNQIIQQLNLKITDRQLPYITLEIQYRPEIGEKSRMVLIEQDTQEYFEENIKRNTSAIGHDISHFIEILAADGYNEIVISPLGCNSEIVISKEYIECAIIDILLDIIMFNSYSFLKSMTVSKKHDFCQEKYDFFCQNDYSCFYEYRSKHKSSKNFYYSFAFSARIDKQTFDFDKYISLWDEFIKTQYKGYKHQEKTILRQLKQHVDFYELPKNLVARFRKRPVGAYLILRTNKDITEDLHPSICTVFGLKRYEKGKIKIIPIEKFESYEFLCKNLDVSVFKIVKW